MSKNPEDALDHIGVRIACSSCKKLRARLAAAEARVGELESKVKCLRVCHKKMVEENKRLESRALPVEIVEMLENLAKEREREPEGSYRGEKILNSMEDAILSWWRTRKNEKE